MQLISKVADIHRVYQDDENRVQDNMDVRYKQQNLILPLVRFDCRNITLRVFSGMLVIRSQYSTGLQSNPVVSIVF